MSSRPGILLAALFGSFAVVLALGAVVGTSAAAPKPAPPSTVAVEPPPTPTAAGQDRNSVRLVVGPGRLTVDGEAVEVFPGVRLLVRTTGPEIRLCLTTPAGTWQLDGKDWGEQPGRGGSMTCRSTDEAELEQPITIELKQK